MLQLIPTPIGNLKDITLRALEALKACDAIICEDSRRTSLLLNHYQIRKPLIVLNDFNEAKMVDQIITRLQTGLNLCLVSDAGSPLISDPGYKLVRECIVNNVAIDSLPGANAAVTALTLSGLPPNKFLFLGFLPEKIGALNSILIDLKNISSNIQCTYIAYVSPYKLVKTLQQMLEVYGDCTITLARELTKIYQETTSKSISIWLQDFQKKSPKGEFVLLFNLKSSKE